MVVDIGYHCSGFKLTTSVQPTAFGNSHAYDSLWSSVTPVQLDSTNQSGIQRLANPAESCSLCSSLRQCLDSPWQWFDTDCLYSVGCLGSIGPRSAWLNPIPLDIWNFLEKHIVLDWIAILLPLLIPFAHWKLLLKSDPSDGCTVTDKVARVTKLHPQSKSNRMNFKKDGNETYVYEDLNLHRWRSNWSCDVLSTQVLITTGLLEAFWGIAAGRGSSCEKMSFTSSKLAKFVHSSQVLTCFEASAIACESARIQGPTLKLHHLVQWQPQYMSMPCPSHFCTNTSDAAEGLIVQKSDTNECLHW